MQMNRREVLRGLSVSLGLPWLESRDAAAAPGMAPSRFVTLYVPNGMVMRHWTPSAAGPMGPLPRILQPLASHASSVRVISGLSTLALPVVPAYHAAASTKFLTASSPSTARGALVKAGMSLDQVAARAHADATPLRSMELALESTELVRVCDAQYSCAYQNTIAWADPFTPMPMESRPRALFERMFGDSAHAAPEARVRALQDDRSILDSVRDGLRLLQREVSASDRLRLAEYVESIRGIERRIDAAERRMAFEADTPALDEQGRSFVEQYTLIVDLLVLALRADITRVCTLMLGCEASLRAYPQLGIHEGHHQLSHHQERPEALDKLARVNRLHVQVLAYLLDRLKEAREDEATLRDRTLVLYGAGMSDSNLHRHDNLPVLLAGGGVKGGVHVRYPEGTPLANLHVSLLRKLGIPVERFGNSTGVLEEL
jgi:hypothetical protein